MSTALSNVDTLDLTEKNTEGIFLQLVWKMKNSYTVPFYQRVLLIGGRNAAADTRHPRYALTKLSPSFSLMDAISISGRLGHAKSSTTSDLYSHTRKRTRNLPNA